MCRCNSLQFLSRLNSHVNFALTVDAHAGLNLVCTQRDRQMRAMTDIRECVNLQLEQHCLFGGATPLIKEEAPCNNLQKDATAWCGVVQLRTFNVRLKLHA